MAVSKRLRFEVLRRDNHACRYCGRTAPEVKLTIDHVVPETLGGRTEPANLVTACADCNSGKSATPPDAAMVSDVSQDAVRWAQAQTVAAAAMLADVEARQEQRQAFLTAWNGWTFEERRVRRTVPLPVTWPGTLDTLTAAGLPMGVLLDCVDRAMRTTKLERGDIFRYMCGIAWKRVATLREATAVAVGAIDSEDAKDIECDHECGHEWWITALNRELSRLPKERYDYHMSGLRFVYGDNLPSQIDSAVQIACWTIRDLANEVYGEASADTDEAA